MSEPRKGELKIYSEIGESGVSSKDFARSLEKLGDVDEVTIYLNSPGGDIFAAHSIYNQIKDHSASFTVVIDGLAASAASYLMLAADKVIMRDNAMVMIHNCMWSASGNYKELQKAASDLVKFNDTLVTLYVRHTGQPETSIRRWMDEETWLSAQEAKALGFVHEVQGSVRVKALTNALEVNGKIYTKDQFKNLPAFEEGQPEVTNTQTMSEKKEEKKEAAQPHAANVEPVLNLDSLKDKHADIYQAVFTEGVAAERARVAELEEFDGEHTKEIVARAKREGLTYAQVSKEISKAAIAAAKAPSVVATPTASVTPVVVASPSASAGQAFLDAAKAQGKELSTVSADARTVTPVDKKTTGEESEVEILKRVFAVRK